MKLSSMVRSALVLALPLAVTSCGKLDSFADLFGSNDMGVAVCPGITIYPVQTGMYTITSVTNIVDGCQTGLTPNLLVGSKRQVSNNNGTLVLEGSNGLDYGSGAFKCNVGTLTFGPKQTADGACQYTILRETGATIKGNSYVVANITETQSMMTASCSVKTQCKTSWTMEMKLNP